MSSSCQDHSKQISFNAELKNVEYDDLRSRQTQQRQRSAYLHSTNSGTTSLAPNSLYNGPQQRRLEYGYIKEENSSLSSGSQRSNDSGSADIKPTKSELKQKLDDMKRVIDGFRTGQMQTGQGKSKIQSILNQKGCQSHRKHPSNATASITIQPTNTAFGNKIQKEQEHDQLQELLEQNTQESPRGESHFYPQGYSSQPPQHNTAKVQTSELITPVPTTQFLHSKQILPSINGGPTFIIHAISPPRQRRDTSNTAYVSPSRIKLEDYISQIQQLDSLYLNAAASTDEQTAYQSQQFIVQQLQHQQSQNQHQEKQADVEQELIIQRQDSSSSDIAQTIQTESSPSALQDKNSSINNHHYQSSSSCLLQRQESSGVARSQHTQKMTNNVKSTDVIQEYQQIIERLKTENDKLSKQLRDSDKSLSQLTSEVTTLRNNAAIHEQIEQKLKEKIHKMQQEYYKNQREQAQSSCDVEQYSVRLREMQDVLQELEANFDQKEAELGQARFQCEQLFDDVQRETEEKVELIAQLQQHQSLIEEQEQEVLNLNTELKGRDQDAQYYREKYEEMQQILDGCQSQMQDFDQVNKMSSDLLEKLQEENQCLKEDLITATDKLEQANSRYFEMLELRSQDAGGSVQYDLTGAQKDFISANGDEYIERKQREGTIQLNDFARTHYHTESQKLQEHYNYYINDASLCENQNALNDVNSGNVSHCNNVDNCVDYSTSQVNSRKNSIGNNNNAVQYSFAQQQRQFQGRENQIHVARRETGSKNNSNTTLSNIEANLAKLENDHEKKLQKLRQNRNQDGERA